MHIISYVRELQSSGSSDCIGYSFSKDWDCQGMDHWAHHMLYLPETLQIPFLNCSIDLITHQLSQFIVKIFSLWRTSLVWWGIYLWVTTDLVPIYALILFYILDASNTHLGLRRLQISAYVPSPHPTYLVPPKLLHLHLPLELELLQFV